MASDYFLKIDGIKGESQDTVHFGEIEVLSFSWGASNSGSPGASGGAAGQVKKQDFNFIIQNSSASPLLYQACATGQHIPTATLSARKAGGNQQDYLVIKLKDVIVSSYQLGGSGGGDDAPTESLSLNFATLTEYKRIKQNNDGSIG